MELNYVTKIGFTTAGKCVLRVMISRMCSNNFCVWRFLLGQQMCASSTDGKLGRHFIDFGEGDRLLTIGGRVGH